MPWSISSVAASAGSPAPRPWASRIARPPWEGPSSRPRRCPRRRRDCPRLGERDLREGGEKGALRVRAWCSGRFCASGRSFLGVAVRPRYATEPITDDVSRGGATQMLSWTPLRNSSCEILSSRRGRICVHRDTTTGKHKLFNPRSAPRSPLVPLHRAQHPVNLVPARVHELESSMNVRLIALNTPAESSGIDGLPRSSLATERARIEDGVRAILHRELRDGGVAGVPRGHPSTPPLGLTLVPFSM